MQLVELADEYRLTTSEAIELCLAAGIPADASTFELNELQEQNWRELAGRQRAFKIEAEKERAAADRATHEAGAGEPGAPSSFGPIPPAPWEQSAAEAADAAVLTAPIPHNGTATSADTDLDPSWGAQTGTGPNAPQVSLYAAAALALSIVSLIFPFVPAILAIPMALYAKHQVRRSNGGLTGERLATAAIVVSAVGVVLWAAIIVVSFAHDYRAEYDRTHAPDLQQDTTTISWDQIGEGQCVRIPRADLPVDEWQGVACNAPHESEVFAKIKLNNGLGERWPGNVAFIALASDECQKAFATYVGVPYSQSELKIGAFFPTASNWTAEQDRTIGCIVYQDNYNLINGSLADANR